MCIVIIVTMNQSRFSSILVDFFQDYAVNYWLDNGATEERLVLGLGFFGKSFILSTNDTGLGAPVEGPAPSGPLGGEGVYVHLEVC